MNFSQANAVSLKVKIIQRGPVHRLCKMALKRQKSLTYIHTGDPFKLSMCFNESGTISAKYLLDTGSGKFHRWDHDLLIFRGCRPLTILVGVTTFKLSHLLKSIVTLASSTLGFRVGVLISSTHSWIILSNLGSIRRWRGSCRVYLWWLLLSLCAACSRLIHCLNSSVEPRVEHLARLFWAMAPRLIFVHLFCLLFSFDSWFLWALSCCFSRSKSVSIV